jgi:hypothetical protein
MTGSSSLSTTMPPPELYSIIASGEKFNLTPDQLQSDPNNYFATYFLGDFEEATRNERELIVEKEPLLFKLIQAHLRGYDILPLADGCIPSYMTKEGALENLLKEALFYGLDILTSKIKDFQAASNPNDPNQIAKLPKWQLIVSTIDRHSSRDLTCASTEDRWLRENAR